MDKYTKINKCGKICSNGRATRQMILERCAEFERSGLSPDEVAEFAQAKAEAEAEERACARVVKELAKQAEFYDAGIGELQADRDQWKDTATCQQQLYAETAAELLDLQAKNEALEAFIRSGKEIGCLFCKYYKTDLHACDECRKNWPCNWQFDETRFAL